LVRALKAGIPPSKIVFSGVGKSVGEIELAIDSDILQINVESEPELALIDKIASQRGKTAAVALRINPDIDAETHTKVATGRREDKFGIEWPRTHEIVNDLATYPNVALVGLAMHIGSQLTNLEPFRSAFTRMRELVTTLRDEGHQILRVDLGGGLGIPYDSAIPPGPDAYAKIVTEVFGGCDYQLLFEPGRLIVGNAGILVTSVIYVKEATTKSFVIVDAAMNDLMRPTLYDAKHEIIPAIQPADGAKAMTADVVGPVCETGDMFAEAISLPDVKSNDLLAVRSAGAYGAVLASSYNTRALIPEVLVRGDEFSVVRRRIDVEELLGYDAFPTWLSDKGPGD
jgi:diaminopimelate decarboxylase